ncbi:MAG: hypothetical protein A4E65_02382 [Syntrophorhabdus sp. PtaU1.Bin153]|nr:MAG: hypothetical protein A4E65_02382 [Syntrophorhabdus sp. PtaU1.Bin153]
MGTNYHTALVTGTSKWQTSDINVPWSDLDKALTYLKNITKVQKLHVTEIATATTDIVITKNGGGSFTAQGTIRAIAYYETISAMVDAP